MVATTEVMRPGSATQNRSRTTTSTRATTLATYLHDICHCHQATDQLELDRNMSHSHPTRLPGVACDTHTLPLAIKLLFFNAITQIGFGEYHSVCVIGLSRLTHAPPLQIWSTKILEFKSIPNLDARTNILVSNFKSMEMDKNSWSWLERWMSAKPWENRLIEEANSTQSSEVVKSPPPKKPSQIHSKSTAFLKHRISNAQLKSEKTI